jgi:hypothetical protein
MKIQLLPAILALSGHPALADTTYSLVRDPSGKLILSAPTCAETETALGALRSWTTRLGERTGDAPRPNPSGQRCSADATASVPALVRELQGRETKANGPNCWNTTLLTLGMVESIRFSIDREMTFWMDSPYCRELDDGETPLPGDAIGETFLRDRLRCHRHPLL